MFRNYLAAALRNLIRNRAVSLVNIAGLAVGFAAVLLIALYVRYERGYDEFIPGHENLYQLSVSVEPQAGVWNNFEEVPHRFAAWLRADFPEVDGTARLTQQWLNVAAGEREFNEPLYYADADFFRLFPIPAVAGDLAGALDAPNDAAISRSLARKYFSVDNPVGEILEIERRRSDRNVKLRVAAVFEDLPGNSHFNFRLVISGKGKTPFTAADGVDAQAAEHWNTPTYFRLKAGTDRARFESQLPAFVARHLPANQAGHTRLMATPVNQVHLAPPARGAMKPRGNPEALIALGIVGAIILFIAVINYVNLTTARAADRGIEVGVRKLHGANRRDLWLQFTVESFLFVTVGMLLAMSLVELALPAFNRFLNPGNELFAAPSIRFDYWRNPALLIMLIGVTALIALVAGAYPSFVMSRMSPAHVVRGVVGGVTGTRIRQWFVVMQFAMLVGLIFASSVIYRQTDFALNAALRIDNEQVVIYNLWGDFGTPGKPAQTFLDELPKVEGVRGVTASSTLPTNSQMAILPFAVPGIDPVPTQIAAVDFNFFDFYRIPLLAGRWLSPRFASDQFDLDASDRELSVLINEAAAKSFGFTPDNAVGKTIQLVYWPGQSLKQPAAIKVAGVTADFPNESVRAPIGPMVMFYFDRGLGTVSIRISGQDIPATMERLRQAWTKFGQPRAQEGWFLDSFYRDLYADVILQKKTLSLFSGCAIFLAVLGLLGLSAWTVQRRTREIGIRKAMGAGTGDIMRMLLWSFSKPVLWASVLAWPLAAWLMYRWLGGFAYRVPLGWWWLPVATGIALTVALLTVSVHSLIAARAPPVQSLRHE